MRVPSSLSAAGCNKDSKAWNCSPIRKRAGAGSTFCRTTCRGGVGNGKLGCVSDFSLVSNVLCLIHLLVIIFDYNYIILYLLYLPTVVFPTTNTSCNHKIPPFCLHSSRLDWTTTTPDQMLVRNFITCHTKARTLQSPIPFRSQWLHHIPRRCFGASQYLKANNAPGGDGGPKLQPELSQHGVFMGTVAVQTPQDTNIREVISKINPEPRGKPSRPNEAPSLLVLLVTPSFAQHALDTDLPLKVSERFQENPTTSKPLDALIAVVDRLPVPRNAPDGVEGIGYAFITNPSPSHVDSQLPLQPNASKPGSLSFDLSTVSHHGPRRVIAQMPLAQTIFSTGLPSTLIYTRYQFDPLSGHLRTQTSQRLESATLPMPEDVSAGSVRLRAPLIPLTFPRLVVSSMGNIVRQLSPLPQPHENNSAESNSGDGQSASPTVFSASQELEAAVSTYFAARGMSPEPVQVWALIMPEDAGQKYPFRSLLNSVLKNNAKAIQQMMVDDRTNPMASGRLLGALSVGARLCKVLSGGGGWGKKAGLLSLDPDSQYSTRELRGDHGWDFTFEGDTTEEMMAAGRKQALGEIVKEGERIVFFLLGPKNLLKDPGADTSSYFPAFVLGALPSSTENEQFDAEARHESGEAAELKHYPWRFGALSEGGMALNVSQPGGPTTQTKVDAPYAVMTAYCFREEKPVAQVNK